MRAQPPHPQPEKQNIDENSLVMGHSLQQQNLGTCTKYNRCISPNLFPSQTPNTPPDQSFQFPSDILTLQQPAQISVQPIIQLQNDGHLVDQLMRSNLVDRKREIKREREEEEKRAREIERNLGRVRDNARKELERAGRRSQEKRPEWGHSIFGDKEKQMKDKSKFKVKSNQKSKQKSRSKSKSKNKVQLKDIKIRIKQYKQNQLKKLQHHKTSQTCLHPHSHQNPEKTPSQIKAEIDKRAQQITKKMKEEKAKIKEDRKLIKAKIRAIQIQSKASLKKFGKRPVDSTIQFVVQVPAVQDKGKERKKGSKKQGKESQISSIKARDDGMASSQFQSRTGSSKMPTNRSKSRRQLKQIDKNTKKSTKSLQQLQTNKNAQENQQLIDSKGKFYFWDMPIYENDCKVINFGLTNGQNLMEQQIKNEKSFRDEVQEYLMQKQRSKMHTENKAAKQKKFQQLIDQKKQQFLSQYSNSNTQSLNNTDQIFWNEDQLFKLEPIKNFK